VQSAGKPVTAPGGVTGSAEPRGDPRHQRQRRQRTRDSGQLEDPSPAQPEDAGTGAHRDLIDRRNGKSRVAGVTPGLEHPEALKDARFEATRRSIAGKAGRCGSRGNLAEASRGATGRARIRGDPRIQLASGAEGREERGNSKLGRRQNPKMLCAGQPVATSGGATGSAGLRGNPTFQSRTSRRMRGSGQLETPSRA
jgi:hypothetical protein